MARLSALRRIRAEGLITSAALLAVTLALVLLASGPIFADAVSTGALRHSLADAPTMPRISKSSQESIPRLQLQTKEMRRRVA